MLKNLYEGLNVKNVYEGLNACFEVYLSKEYFCKMYPTCVSSKICEFIYIFHVSKILNPLLSSKAEKFSIRKLKFYIDPGYAIRIVISGQGDAGEPGFSDVWLCMCDTDLCNSASKQTIAAIFTCAFVVLALAIL